MTFAPDFPPPARPSRQDALGLTEFVAIRCYEERHRDAGEAVLALENSALFLGGALADLLEDADSRRWEAAWDALLVMAAAWSGHPEYDRARWAVRSDGSPARKPYLRFSYRV